MSDGVKKNKPLTTEIKLDEQDEESTEEKRMSCVLEALNLRPANSSQQLNISLRPEGDGDNRTRSSA